MRIYLGFLFVALFGLAGVAAAAGSVTMDTVGVGSKYTEGKDTENWLSCAGDVKTDWLDLRVTGKFYVTELSDDYEDTSDDGQDDLFSRIQAAGNFAGALEGLEVKLGDKWNAANEILFWGAGYKWSPWENWTFKVRYNESYRDRIVGDGSYAYEIRQEEVALKFAPKNWSYALKLNYSDKDYPKLIQNGANYSYAKLSMDQDLKWEINDQWNVELDYHGSETDYLYRKDGSRQKWTLKAGFRQNEDWDWDGSIYQSDYHSDTNDSQTRGVKLKCKYDPEGPWRLATSLALTDYQYSRGYTQPEDEKQDLDGDYSSRQQRSLTVEYRHQLARLAYNIEIFVKQYDYENYDPNSYQNGTVMGGIGSLDWDWGRTKWQLQAAPNGDLTTRRAKYELKATYHF